eukprot:3631738-Rhodomonas_salina.1
MGLQDLDGTILAKIWPAQQVVMGLHVSKRTKEELSRQILCAEFFTRGAKRARKLAIRAMSRREEISAASARRDFRCLSEQIELNQFVNDLERGVALGLATLRSSSGFTCKARTVRRRSSRVSGEL